MFPPEKQEKTNSDQNPQSQNSLPLGSVFSGSRSSKKKTFLKGLSELVFGEDLEDEKLIKIKQSRKSILEPRNKTEIKKESPSPILKLKKNASMQNYKSRENHEEPQPEENKNETTFGGSNLNKEAVVSSKEFSSPTLRAQRKMTKNVVKRMRAVKQLQEKYSPSRLTVLSFVAGSNCWIELGGFV